jgi:hypothetical protein
VLLRDGWPRAHDHYAQFQRIEGFRRAFAAGLWYPLWTPFAARGFGSPYPLFYHRLYSTMGALLSRSAAGVITSVKAMTVLILFAGGTGMRRLLRISGVGEAFAMAGGVLLMISPYVLNDWLVRAAMAELLAMMMLPWLYAEMALFLKGERHWIRFGIELVLLFHAHSLLCYWFLLSFVPFTLLSVTPGWRQRAWGGAAREWPRAAAAVAIAVLGVVPHVVVMQSVRGYFNMESLTTVSYLRVENNFFPPWKYIVDPFSWSTTYTAGSVEINRYACIALLGSLALPGVLQRYRTASEIPLFTFFLVWTAICLLLQLPESLFVFNTLPQGRFIQFPWRLLAFITIGVVFMLMTTAQAMQEKLGAAMVACTVALTLVHFGTVPVFRTETLVSQGILTALTTLSGPNSGGEYELNGMTEQTLPNKRLVIVATMCADKLKTNHAFAADGLQVSADLTEPCRISVAQYQTPLLAIELENAELVSPTPSIAVLIELHPGHSSVRIRPKTFWEMLTWAAGHHEAAPTDPPRA